MKNRILFVDDDPMALKGLRRALQDYGDLWDADYCTSAAEAEQLFCNQTYDVAIVDVFMPMKNGLDLLRDIKSDPQTSDMEVIILTGMEEGHLKRQALDLGATDLLSKPVETEDLAARIRNVLKIRTYREELRKKNAILEQQLIRSHKMEMVGLLAAGVAHDLNNILTIITVYGELARRKLATTPEVANVEDLVKKMVSASSKAGIITGQILKFSKQTAEVKELCHVSDIVATCIDMASVLVSKTIEVVLSDKSKGGKVYADSGQLHQVFMNLIINGAHAMGDKGLLKIEISEKGSSCDSEFSACDPSDKWLKVSVSDTGHGMDAETLQHIFDPLFTTKGENGTGLGLAVVHLIVKNYRGNITVDSRPGSGSTFTVFLPATDAVLPSPTQYRGVDCDECVTKNGSQ